LYARRPLDYYLRGHGFSTSLLPDLLTLLTTRLNWEDLALYDEAIDRTLEETTVPSSWEPIAGWPNRLDPVTRLDVAPDEAFDATIRKEFLIQLLIPEVPRGVY
jgi:hypothetical protein